MRGCCQSGGVGLLRDSPRGKATLAKSPPPGRPELTMSSWQVDSRGESGDGEEAQCPRSSRQTPQQADWPGCGDPRFQDRLFVPQSWVCLITGIELNVLFCGSLLTPDISCVMKDLCFPQPSTPQLPPQTCPLERFLFPHGRSWGYEGTGRVKVTLDLHLTHPCKSSPETMSWSPSGHDTTHGIMSGLHSRESPC